MKSYIIIGLKECSTITCLKRGSLATINGHTLENGGNLTPSEIIGDEILLDYLKKSDMIPIEDDYINSIILQ